MGKKHFFPIAVHIVGSACRYRGGNVFKCGSVSRCRIHLHGAYTVTFIRGRRDRSPWRDEGRKRQLFRERVHRWGRWTDPSTSERLNSVAFVRDPWKRGASSLRSPARPSEGGCDRNLFFRGIQNVIMGGKLGDQSGTFVGRISGVGADGQ